MDDYSAIRQRFEAMFGPNPLVVKAPGRINLIGEHTDYNQGWVLPAAINKSIVMAVGPRDDGRICLFSEDYQEGYECEADQLSRSGKLWPDYILGVVQQFRKDGHALGGFNLVFGGDIPLGAGLSSSAALECGTGVALNALFGLGYTTLELAQKGQAAENEFVGVQCGLMDQYASMFGRKGQLIQLDCAKAEHRYIPFQAGDLSIVLFDTQVKHSLASSEYNQRRKECEEGVNLVRKKYPLVRSLRDVNEEILLSQVKPYDETVYRRCSYVVGEMARLRQACDHLEENDFVSFGQCMFETHEGLKNLYEVSCAELDVLVDLVKGYPAVLGARMMGGGFGGCTINLVRGEAVEELTGQVAEGYKKATGRDLLSYLVQIEDGAAVVDQPESLQFGTRIKKG